MNQMPPLELLEATHEFPGKYIFKAIGPNSDEFIEDVVAVIRTELQHDFDSPYQLTRSTHGRHVSVTIEPIIDAPEQVLAIYEKLRNVAGLAMLL